MDRRDFLKMAGATGAAAGVAGLGLRGRSAHADDTVPKRIILVSSCHGSVWDHWSMDPRGKGDGQWEADLTTLGSGDFSRVLAPLFPHRDRLVVLDGLSMVSAELDIPGYRHEKGWIHAWTGAEAAFTGTNLYATQPSLDQLIARQIARPDRLPSLELSIGEARPICHGGYAQQLPLQSDPRRVWDRLFGLSNSADPMVAAQGSVLDYVLGEHGALGGPIAASDLARIDAHYELVRALEQRIDGLRQASCQGLDPSTLATTSAGYDALWDAMSELVASAFACDLTRVATLSLGDLPSSEFGWGDYLSGDAHNDFAHRLYEDDQAALAMADYNRHHAQQIARLVALLESIPEGDGSLMDHTLIVWGNELADGWHGYERLPAVVIGGEWAFRTGRYLRWSYESTPVPLVAGTGTTSGAGLPHQQLLVSAARAMGLDVDHVGQASANHQGRDVDLSGELFELL
jgi:hypothetical protein